MARSASSSTTSTTASLRSKSKSFRPVSVRANGPLPSSSKASPTKEDIQSNHFSTLNGKQNPVHRFASSKAKRKARDVDTNCESKDNKRCQEQDEDRQSKASSSRRKRERYHSPPSSESSETEPFNLHDFLRDANEKDAAIAAAAAKPKNQEFRPTHIHARANDTCLAKVKTCYYFAKLKAFKAAVKREDKDFYEVEMFDKEIRQYDSGKDVIFLDETDRLATCHIGDFRLGNQVFSLRENPRERLENSKLEAEERAKNRSTPPLIAKLDFDSITPTDFGTLAIEDQVIVMRSHLQRIINEEYGPAQWRNDIFFDPRRRVTLEQYASRGAMEDIDVDYTVIPELQRWIKKVKEGSLRFMNLSPKAKAEFANDVLLPEFMIAWCIKLNDFVNDEGYLEPAGRGINYDDSDHESGNANHDRIYPNPYDDENEVNFVQLDTEKLVSDIEYLNKPTRDITKDPGFNHLDVIIEVPKFQDFRAPSLPSPPDAYRQAIRDLNRQYDWKYRIDQVRKARTEARKAYKLPSDELEELYRESKRREREKQDRILRMVKSRLRNNDGVGDGGGNDVYVEDCSMDIWKVSQMRRRGELPGRSFAGRLLKKVNYKE